MGHDLLAGLFALLIVTDRVALRARAGVRSHLEAVDEGTSYSSA